MPAIATLSEFASLLQTDVDTATASLVLLDLAQGLVTEQIGVQDPWPSIAKTIALNAAQRAYLTPDATRLRTVGGVTDGLNTPLYTNGVFLTEKEKAALHDWSNGPGGSTLGQPQGCFPDARAWPDPVEIN